MKSLRVAVSIVAVLVWGLAAPLAMAADNCVAMGAMCEGPCGVSSCVVSPLATGDITRLVAAASPAPASSLPEIDQTVLELPPK
jgi:hypothetical protein